MTVIHRTLAALAALLVPAPLLAHEGHGFEGTLQSLLHWVSDPYHVALLAAIALVAVGIPLWLRRASNKDAPDVERLP